VISAPYSLLTQSRRNRVGRITVTSSPSMPAISTCFSQVRYSTSPTSFCSRARTRDHCWLSRASSVNSCGAVAATPSRMKLISRLIQIHSAVPGPAGLDENPRLRKLWVKVVLSKN
jgi:hypothetical protein